MHHSSCPHLTQLVVQLLVLGGQPRLLLPRWAVQLPLALLCCRWGRGRAVLGRLHL